MKSRTSVKLFNKRTPLIFLLLYVFAAVAPSQTLPTKTQILAKIKSANDFFITNKANDPCTNCLPGNRSSFIWTRGVYYEGDLAYYAISRDTTALNYAIKWGTFHSWNLNGGASTTSADNQCAGQSYIDLFRIDQKQEQIATIKTCIDAMVSGSSNSYWTWIDALQMAMPVFAKLGKQYPTSTGYSSKMYSLYNYTKTTLKLYNTTDHLWWRDTTFIKAKSPAGKNVYWSRGNGWVFAALARVLSEIPATESHRLEYETIFKDMAAALKGVQRTDGFWNENLADPTHYGGPEVTGTGLFTYGMAWGVNQKLLAQADYLPTIVKAWKAVADSAILPTGALGYVQGSGSGPGDNGSGKKTVTPSKDIVPDFIDFGLGCVLLAGSEVAKLSDSLASSVQSPWQSRMNLQNFNAFISKGNLTIQNEDHTRLDVSVSNALGRVILRKSITGTDNIPLPNRSKNAIIYFVKIASAGKVVAFKRILAH